jgi:peptide/nickel transport system permease protein
MIVMRLTDVQLTVPSILMALLVDGIARGLFQEKCMMKWQFMF